MPTARRIAKDKGVDMHESQLLHFAEHRLQEVALLIMATVYTIRLIWLFRFKAGGDRQGRTGRFSTSPKKGAFYSLANVAMPWAMESTRTNPIFWIQFALFHLGVTAAIALSFVIPYAPSLLNQGLVVLGFQAFIGAACLIGCYRMYRRISDKTMRAISTPDDYFSLALLTVWFAFGVLAAPNDTLERGRDHAHLLPADGLLPDLRALQQDRALPLLSDHALLPGQEPRVQRGLPDSEGCQIVEGGS